MASRFTMFALLGGVLLFPFTVQTLDLDRIMQEAKDEYETDLMTKTLAGAKSIHHRRKFTKESQGMETREAIIRRAVDRLTTKEGMKKKAALAAVRNFMEDRMLECGRVGGYGNHANPVSGATDACSQTTVQCSPKHKYRAITGRCNNLQNPRWGSMSIAMRRFAPPRYADSNGTPRSEGTALGRNEESRKGDMARQLEKQAQSGLLPLPNARLVSIVMHGDVASNDRIVTHMFTQMGQFIDHDITLTPECEVEHCCSNLQNTACFPIHTPVNDTFYRSRKVTCLDFVRSTAFCTDQTKQREQMNAITAWVDASNVYGSSDSAAKALRLLKGGLLKTTLIAGKEFLPRITDDFTAGDIRALEMPGLATMHTLFVREHNRIARAIAGLEPSWNDEKIYQETRRIVIAEMQNVVFGQYLDVLLGPTRPGTASHGYNSVADPSIRNEFATAAFRFGHSMIQGLINMMTTAHTISRQYQLRENFFNLVNYLRDNGDGMEQILTGLVNQPSQAMDRFMSQELTRFLFPEPGANFGSDLAARNIQRGRDHGLNGYNAYRKVCAMTTIDSWSQRPHEITDTDWNKLQSLYKVPDDIDLFTIGLVEKPIPGSIVGPLFNCLISKQFHLLKDADRFFFTHCGQAGSFTPEQIKVLQKRTLRDIICDNTDISIARPNVFLLSSVKESCTKSFNLPIKLFVPTDNSDYTAELCKN